MIVFIAHLIQAFPRLVMLAHSLKRAFGPNWRDVLHDLSAGVDRLGAAAHGSEEEKEALENFAQLINRA